MKKLTVIAVLIASLGINRPASASCHCGEAELLAVGVGLSIPIAYGVCYGLSMSPAIHMIGSDEAVCGLDWVSMASISKDVYGLQLSFIGGGVKGDLYGFQLGILGNGFVWKDKTKQEEIDSGAVNGLQYGTFYGRAGTVRGMALSAGMSQVKTMEGIQVGLVNKADELYGTQIGIFNTVKSGVGLQVGVVNHVENQRVQCLPIMNLTF